MAIQISGNTVIDNSKKFIPVTSVAVGSGRIVVGAYGDEDNGTSFGSAYIYNTPQIYTPYDAIELQSV